MTGQSKSNITASSCGLLLGRVATELNNLELRVEYSDKLHEKKTKAS